MSISLQWKDGKISKVIVKSTLGGNLRLRLPHAMKFDNGKDLAQASGNNPNKFFFVDETPKPVISAKAEIELLKLPETFVYDITTTPGKTYTFVPRGE